MSFLTFVDYKDANDIPMDTSIYAKSESIANVLRAPGRWFAAQCWNGGKMICITNKNPNSNESSSLVRYSQGTDPKTTMQKILRLLVGAVLSIPGHALAIPFMSFALISQEIRLKHQFSVRDLTKEENEQLKALIEERKSRANQKQGCEPITCILCSICCLLCTLVCRGNDRKKA